MYRGHVTELLGKPTYGFPGLNYCVMFFLQSVQYFLSISGCSFAIIISLANFSIGNMTLKWSNTSCKSAVDQTKGLPKSGRPLVCTRERFPFFKITNCLKTFSIIAFHLTNESNRKNRIAMVKNRIASNRKVKKSLQPY